MKTVLKYVQTCLDTMDSDAVDDISETEESLQVATFLKETYYELLNREEWKFLTGAATLTGNADLSSPTSFTIEGEVKAIEYVAYQVADTGDDAEMRELVWCEPIDFLKRFGSPGDNRLFVTFGSKISFYVGTDRQPSYYTSFDDETIICDSYDSAIESTLQTSKTNVIATVIPPFSLVDTLVPDIPTHMEPLLQAELNAVSHLWLKQSVSAPDERRAGRQLAQARRKHTKTKDSKQDYFRNRFGRR